MTLEVHRKYKRGVKMAKTMTTKANFSRFLIKAIILNGTERKTAPRARIHNIIANGVNSNTLVLENISIAEQNTQANT